jgi:hypothetical protein
MSSTYAEVNPPAKRKGKKRGGKIELTEIVLEYGTTLQLWLQMQAIELMPA